MLCESFPTTEVMLKTYYTHKPYNGMGSLWYILIAFWMESTFLRPSNLHTNKCRAHLVNMLEHTVHGINFF